MTVHKLPVSRSTENPADLAQAVHVDLYMGRHDLGTQNLVVAAYRVAEVWKPFPWSWFTPDDNHVFLEVPEGTNLNPHEVLIVT